MATFGEKVKSIRFHMGYSQEEIGNLLGVSKQAISKYENEQTSPRIDTVANFAQILRIDLVFLVSDDFSTQEVIQAIENRDLSIKPLMKKSETPKYTGTLIKLVNTANELNNEGQEKVADYAEDLVDSGKYSKLQEAPVTYQMAANDGNLSDEDREEILNMIKELKEEENE